MSDQMQYPEEQDSEDLDARELAANRFANWIRRVFPCAVVGCDARFVDCVSLLDGSDDGAGRAVALCERHARHLAAVGLFAFQKEMRVDLIPFAQAIGERYRNTSRVPHVR